ncbi:MAG: FAD-dependent oxidoreductase, partial [Myxococcota bacterium]
MSTGYPSDGGRMTRDGAQPDVVIVGAGIAGLATAWHLAPGRRVHLVDQAGVPGAESSTQGVGMVRRLGEDPIERALAVRTSAWLREVPFAPGGARPRPRARSGRSRCR